MDPQELVAALTAPFPAEQISWKPQALSKDKKKALAVAYIDARDVAERLDNVIGPLNWQLDHKQVDGQIITGLAIRAPETSDWVWKWDTGFVFGAESESADDQMKARKGTISDGLKRAAVLWGIGRYLYRLPKVWVEYDAEHRRLAALPTLPQWALPDAERKPVTGRSLQAVQRLTQPDGNGNGNGNGHLTIEQARLVISPVAPKEHPEFKGKTLGELLAASPKFVDWLATVMSTNDDPDRQTAKRAASVLIAAEPVTV